jgi:hypothetical protein
MNGKKRNTSTNMKMKTKMNMDMDIDMKNYHKMLSLAARTG